MADATHKQSEDFPWTIAVVDHPPRKDSPGYVASRKLMNELVRTLDEWPFAPGPYEDHHGGGLWVKDDTGWFALQSLLGIEWSAIFCADPAKVDTLRRYVARVLAAFPATIQGYAALGYPQAEKLIATPITTTKGVEAWADSIFNASLPLPHSTHTGVLPTGAGYHHYPKPIVDIDHFRYDDFDLFVTDPDGLPAAVVPVAPRGSGNGRVRLLAVHPSSRYVRNLLPTGRAVGDAAPDDRYTSNLVPGGRPGPAPRDPALLPATDPLARQAFAHQS
jgi:hypothetical protein